MSRLFLRAKQLFWVALSSLVAVAIGTLGLADSKESICSVPALLPGVDCVVTSPSNAAAVVGVIPLIGVIVLIELQRRKVQRSVLAEIESAGVSAPIPRSWYALTLLQWAVGLLAVIYVGIASAQTDTPGAARSLRVWPVLVVLVVVAIASFVSTNWRHELLLRRLNKRVGAEVFDEADGGYTAVPSRSPKEQLAQLGPDAARWVTLDVRVAKTSSLPEIDAPFGAGRCVAWSWRGMVERRDIVRQYTEEEDNSYAVEAHGSLGGSRKHSGSSTKPGKYPVLEVTDEWTFEGQGYTGITTHYIIERWLEAVGVHDRSSQPFQAVLDDRVVEVRFDDIGNLFPKTTSLKRMKRPDRNLRDQLIAASSPGGGKKKAHVEIATLRGGKKVRLRAFVIARGDRLVAMGTRGAEQLGVPLGPSPQEPFPALWER